MQVERRAERDHEVRTLPIAATAVVRSEERSERNPKRGEQSQLQGGNDPVRNGHGLVANAARRSVTHAPCHHG